MSQESVERYLRGVDAWNRGALDDWLRETVTPRWELVTGGAFPGLAATYRGREGAIEMWEALRGPWDAQDLHIEVERIEDLGDTALALLTMRASGNSSKCWGYCVRNWMATWPQSSASTTTASPNERSMMRGLRSGNKATCPSTGG